MLALPAEVLKNANVKGINLTNVENEDVLSSTESPSTLSPSLVITPQQSSNEVKEEIPPPPSESTIIPSPPTANTIKEEEEEEKEKKIEVNEGKEEEEEDNEEEGEEGEGEEEEGEGEEEVKVSTPGIFKNLQSFLCKKICSHCSKCNCSKCSGNKSNDKEEETIIDVSGGQIAKKKKINKKNKKNKKDVKNEKKIDLDSDISKLPRGKRSKIKRIKAKYGNQCEEDKEYIYIYNNNNIIRLYLLSVGQKNMKDIINTSSETKEEEKEKEKEEIEKEKDVEKVIKCCYGCGSTDHLYKDCQNKSNINPYILCYYNIYIICREEEENEVNKIKEEENIYDINKNDSSFFQTLISKPEGDDILLYAIPVSVPIEAAKVFYFILFI